MNPMGMSDFKSSIGVPIPSTDISLRDDDGNVVAQGEEGELCAKGPQVMKGYWRRDDATAEVMTEDGYFKTGELEPSEGGSIIEGVGINHVTDNVAAAKVDAAFTISDEEALLTFANTLITHIEGTPHLRLFFRGHIDAEARQNAREILRQDRKKRQAQTPVREKIKGYEEPKSVANTMKSGIKKAMALLKEEMEG